MKITTDHAVKIAIVGVGNVGATFAYALLGSGLASQIVLIDANEKRAEGEEGPRDRDDVRRSDNDRKIEAADKPGWGKETDIEKTEKGE